jgi:DNA recombination protein RmuC
MNGALLVLVGVVVGAAVVLVVVWVRRRPAAQLAQELLASAQQEKIQDLDRIIEQLREAFKALSRDALDANKADFLQLAETRLKTEADKGAQTLDAKKELIDKTLEAMQAKLIEVSKTLQTLENARREAHGGLIKEVQKTSQVTLRLQETTAQLREALANPQARGQWAERMAEDVLRAAGMIEGINYVKQTQVSGGTRPDFTFLLPRDLRVNMDVKFPSKKYMEYLEAPDEAAADARKREFLRDVRARVKEVTTREYVDTAAGTVDYVLVFIPNEQIYGFIHQHDPALLDDALAKKVVLCSPFTLYAILAVIRQSVENFQLERASEDILRLLGEFRKQWDKYAAVLEKMGGKLEDAVQAYQELTTTRTRALDRQLDRIDDLCAQRLPGPDAEASGTT